MHYPEHSANCALHVAFRRLRRAQGLLPWLAHERWRLAMVGPCAGLDWTGLDWTGRTGLDWTGRTGLDWSGVVWYGTWANVGEREP